MSASKKVTLQIKGKNVVVVQHCALAESIHSRLVGLLNHSRLGDDEGLLITPCNQVHTLFMRFAIDAIFLSPDWKVLAIKELKPWRISPLIWKSKSVLEIPIGVSQKIGLNIGDELELHPC
jgi:uncharacterized membrane protein (UPF0127 family)